MTMSENLLDLMHDVAAHLTGWPVVVRLQHSQYKGDLGTCHKDPAGRIVIDVKPDLDDDTFLKVFVHELAHAKAHAKQFARSNVNRPPQSVNTPPTPRSLATKRREQERAAEYLAKHWLSWARLNEYPDEHGTQLEITLRTLKRY